MNDLFKLVRRVGESQKEYHARLKRQEAEHAQAAASEADKAAAEQQAVLDEKAGKLKAKRQRDAKAKRDKRAAAKLGVVVLR